MEPVSYNALKFETQQLELAPELKPSMQQETEGKNALSFKDLMTNMVSEVDRLQKDADTAVSDLVAGRRSDVHNIAVKMDEAGVAFDLMLQIRNKMLDGFKEISQIQA